MFIRVALTNVEKEWLRLQPAGTVVVPYLDPTTGTWSINTAEALLGGATPPSIQEPDDVTNLVATVVSATRIDLSWDYAGPDPEGFFIYQNGTLRQPVYNEAAVSFICDNLTPDTVYAFEVSTFNTVLRFEGTKIAANIIKTPAGTPTLTAPTITDPGGQVVTLGGSLSLQITTANGVPFTNSPVLPRTVLENPGTLDNYGSITSAGLWTWTPTEVGTFTQVIAAYDRALQRVEVTVPVAVNAASIAVTPPNTPDMTADYDVAYDSGTFTVTGGVTPLRILTDFLPTGLAVSQPTARTFKISGTGTQQQAGSYPLNIVVEDHLGVQFPVSGYILQYSVPAAPVNTPPAWLSTLPDSIVLQVGSTWAGFDLDAHATDADGNTLSYGLEALTDKDGVSRSLADIGLSINGTTHVLAATSAVPSGADAYSTLALNLYVDDGVAEALRISENIIRTVITGAAPVAGQGASHTGGSGTAVYALRNTADNGAGTAPPWFGTLNTSTGIFPMGVASPNNVVTAGTWSFRIAVAKGSERQITPTITVVGAAAPSDDLATHMAMTDRYATDFKDVYKDGAIVASRQINALGTAGTAGSNAQTLIGQASQTNNSANLLWVDHPTRSGKKMLRIPTDATIGATAGSWFVRTDGTPGLGENGVLAEPRLYVRARFFAHRDLFRWRFSSNNGDQTEALKLLYLGNGFANGELVVQAVGDTGFTTYGLLINGSTSLDSLALLPTPNPWGSSSLRRLAPLIDNGGPLVTKSDGYRRFGGVRGSGVGYQKDFDVGAANAEKWLDLRSYPLDGVEQGLPAQCMVDSGQPIIHLDAWNEIEVFGFYNAGSPSQSTVQFWAARAGSPPVLVFSFIGNVPFGSNPSGTWQQVGIVSQATHRAAEPGRPAQKIDWDSLLISRRPIPFTGQGVTLPPGNLG